MKIGWLGEFPEEIIWIVFQHMDYKDLFSLSLSNKRLYKAIIIKNKVFKSLMIRKFPYQFYQRRKEIRRVNKFAFIDYFEEFGNLIKNRFYDDRILKLEKRFFKEIIENLKPKKIQFDKGRLMKRLKDNKDLKLINLTNQYLIEPKRDNSGKFLTQSKERLRSMSILEEENCFVDMNNRKGKEKGIHFFGDAGFYGHFVPRSKKIANIEDFVYYICLSMIKRRNYFRFLLRCRNDGMFYGSLNWDSVLSKAGNHIDPKRMIPFYDKKVLQFLFLKYDGNTFLWVTETKSGFYFFEFYTS